MGKKIRNVLISIKFFDNDIPPVFLKYICMSHAFELYIYQTHHIYYNVHYHMYILRHQHHFLILR